MQTEHLQASIDVAVAQLAPLADRDWSVTAGDLEWTCHHTLDHLVDTLVRYASNLACRADHGIRPLRPTGADASIEDLLVQLRTAATLLNRVAEASPDDARGYHPSGMADAAGFLAMGATETLIHTDDILRGLGVSWDPVPDDATCNAILGRIFPWAPDTDEAPDRFQVFRWSCGRTALPTRERLDPTWWWHAAPLSEWDGTRKQRPAPKS